MSQIGDYRFAIATTIGGLSVNLNHLKMKHLCSPKGSGGANLVHLAHRDNSLKVSWIQIIETDEELANFAYRKLAPKLGENIWRCNLDKQDVNHMYQKLDFWTDVLKAWCSINFTPHVQQPRQQLIWNNSHIRIKNKPISWPRSITKGLMTIGQIFPDGKRIKFDIAEEQYNLTIMEVNSLISAIPAMWRKGIKEHAREEELIKQSLYDRLRHHPHITSKTYSLLQQESPSLMDKCEKWELDLQENIEYSDYLNSFANVYKVTNITKMRSFQYRLLHRSIITNIHLCKWGKTLSNLCSFCNQQPETVLHLFIYCPKIKELWIGMELFMERFSSLPICFNVQNVLWNKLCKQAGHVKNAICLFVKQYIYRQRCLHKNISLGGCKNYVMSIHNNEKYYAIKNSMLIKHQKKWNPDSNAGHESERTVTESQIENFIQQHIYQI